MPSEQSLATADEKLGPHAKDCELRFPLRPQCNCTCGRDANVIAFAEALDEVEAGVVTPEKMAILQAALDAEWNAALAIVNKLRHKQASWSMVELGRLLRHLKRPIPEENERDDG